tara:strand:+ start:21574 stop:22164 length:591 start_codon:yes stop_codon:yes gene_type:complete
LNTIGIIGAGGHGKVVADTAHAAGWRTIVFFDQSWPERQSNGLWPIIGKDPEGAALFCAVGRNATRAALFETYMLQDSPLLAHPSAILSPSAVIGAGTLVVAGVIVNAETRIGHGVILNTGCSVDHECQIADFVHVSPGARLAGGVRVGARSWIGIGAVVREGVCIGQDVMVAAGAAVITDLPDGARVGGVPAHPI